MYDTSSPWTAKSRFVPKSSGDIRPVHQICALNEATIKPNHPMGRVVVQPRFKVYWWAEQQVIFCTVQYRLFLLRYLQMAQGLCRVPAK